MLNWYVVAYLIVNVLSIGIMFYVMWIMLRELRRPKNAFTRLRLLLLLSPMFILIGLVLGMPRLIQNLHLVTDTGQNIRIIGGMIVLGGFSIFKLLIYTYKEKE